MARHEHTGWGSPIATLIWATLAATATAASEISGTLETAPPPAAQTEPAAGADRPRANRYPRHCTASTYVFDYKGVPLGSDEKCLRKMRRVECSRIASATGPAQVEVCYLQKPDEKLPFDRLAGKTVFPQYHYVDGRLYLVKLTMADPVDIDPVAEYLSERHGAPHDVARDIVDVQGIALEAFTLIWRRGRSQIEVKTFNEAEKTATVYYYDIDLLQAARREIEQTAEDDREW